MTRQSTIQSMAVCLCSAVIFAVIFFGCAGDNKAKTTATPKKDSVAVEIKDSADTRPIKPGSK
jgi:hypothetical protein